MQSAQLIGAMIAGGGDADAAALESLLEVSDSLMTYRSRYYSRFQLAAVLDLLISDETNPRSVAYKLAVTRKTSSMVVSPARHLATPSSVIVAMPSLRATLVPTLAIRSL